MGIVIESATAADHRNLDHGLVSFETEYFASDAICEKARAGELFQPIRLVTHKHTGNLRAKYIGFTTNK